MPAATTVAPKPRTIKELEAIVGSLSSPSKMPCYGYSIPAVHCKVGSMMRSVEGSICGSCYALKGRYVFPSVKAAMERRYRSLTDPHWIETMVELIGRKESSGYFRWHDSGDLQGDWHLAMICAVAEALPDIQFWLPTREYKVVSEYQQNHTIPANLTIRLSALMFDDVPPLAIIRKTGLPISGAATNHAHTCPAPQQGNQCGTCRACWDPAVDHVTYAKH